MHCFHIDLFPFDHHSLADSMRLMSAFAVENELQDRRLKEVEESFRREEQQYEETERQPAE